jgi:hypothetical protein
VVVETVAFTHQLQVLTALLILAEAVVEAVRPLQQ